MGRSFERLVSSLARRCIRLRGFTPSPSAVLPGSMPCQKLLVRHKVHERGDGSYPMHCHLLGAAIGFSNRESSGTVVEVEKGES